MTNLNKQKDVEMWLENQPQKKLNRHDDKTLYEVHRHVRSSTLYQIGKEEHVPDQG